MSEETITPDQFNELLFMQLVMMFQGMAMQQLGKVANPATQQVERDLGQAKNYIDLLSMIETKTNGNLNDQEKQLLEHALFELRMNYVDESKKAASESSSDDESGPDEESSPGEQTAADESGPEAQAETDTPEKPETDSETTSE